MHRLILPVFPSTYCLLPSYTVLGQGGTCLKDDRLDEIIISSNLDPPTQKDIRTVYLYNTLRCVIADRASNLKVRPGAVHSCYVGT